MRSQLLQKELRESATKSLETDGFPVGLADVLDYSSKERMEETLKNLLLIIPHTCWVQRKAKHLDTLV